MVELKEGDKKTITQICKKARCERCGELATHQLTFLLPNARGNPASSAYGRDDCSWCSDEKMFVCDEHKKEKHRIADELGMSWCADFPDGNRFKHLFLYWETIKEKS